MTRSPQPDVSEQPLFRKRDEGCKKDRGHIAVAPIVRLRACARGLNRLQELDERRAIRGVHGAEGRLGRLTLATVPEDRLIDSARPSVIQEGLAAAHPGGLADAPHRTGAKL